MSDEFEHGPAHSGLSDVGVVLAGRGGACVGALGAFVAWLVEVWLVHQNERLDRNKHLWCGGDVVIVVVGWMSEWGGSGGSGGRMIVVVVDE